MPQLALDWFLEKLPIRYKNALMNTSQEDIEHAKQMQKEQMIRFAISCHQDILRDRNAPENLISENLYLFEDYFNKYMTDK